MTTLCPLTHLSRPTTIPNANIQTIPRPLTPPHLSYRKIRQGSRIKSACTALPALRPSSSIGRCARCQLLASRFWIAGAVGANFGEGPLEGQLREVLRSIRSLAVYFFALFGLERGAGGRKRGEGRVKRKRLHDGSRTGIDNSCVWTRDYFTARIFTSFISFFL